MDENWWEPYGESTPRIVTFLWEYFWNMEPSFYVLAMLIYSTVNLIDYCIEIATSSWIRHPRYYYLNRLRMHFYEVLFTVHDSYLQWFTKHLCNPTVEYPWRRMSALWDNLIDDNHDENWWLDFEINLEDSDFDNLDSEDQGWVAPNNEEDLWFDIEIDLADSDIDKPASDVHNPGSEDEGRVPPNNDDEFWWWLDYQVDWNDSDFDEPDSEDEGWVTLDSDDDDSEDTWSISSEDTDNGSVGGNELHGAVSGATATDSDPFDGDVLQPLLSANIPSKFESVDEEPPTFEATSKGKSSKA